MGISLQGKTLWNALFTRTQRQLLSLFFGFPDRSFYANEVVRKARVGTGSVQRELTRLAGSGLLTVKKVGNQKHYQANRGSPIYPELRGIVVKTFGAVDRLRRAVKALPGQVELALLFEDRQHPTGSAINLLLVSDDLGYPEVMKGLAETGRRLGRAVEPVLYGTREFRELRDQGNVELQNILQQPKVFLSGSLGQGQGVNGP